MSIERVERQAGVVWRVRWREGGRNRSRVVGRKRDAEAFDAEVKRSQRLGGFSIDAADETLDQYVCGAWAHAHAAHLAPKTRQVYGWAYDVHIAPRLAGVPLRQMNPEIVARFQADLLAAGVGPEAVRKSVTLLGGILQRAAEARRIPFNPARVVRKARRPQRDEVRPLAPATVESMRAAVPRRDASLISVLAYAGLRPQELRGLRWGTWASTRCSSTPRRQASGAACACSLRWPPTWPKWRLACGRPSDAAPVFAGSNGKPWGGEGFNK